VKWTPWTALALVAWELFALRGPPLVAGDAQEYLIALQSWADHGSPEQRPGDVQAVAALLRAHGHTIGAASNGYFPDAQGRWYGYHFWVYALMAVPAKLVLRALHRDELGAFEAANLALFAAALVGAMRARSLPPARRSIFVVLAALGPVLWYVRWPHAEIYLWSFVVLGLAQLDARRYVVAAALFSMAAMQMQPLALLAAACVALSLRARRWRTTLATACAALPSLAPAAFYLWHFGHPSPMAAAGLLRWPLVSLERVASFFLDFDQGMLVHAPATVVLGVSGIAFAARVRAYRAIVIALTAVAMAAAMGTTVNWNAGCCGMLRYGVWVMPLFAWIAARWLPRSPLAIGACALVVFAQLHHVGTRVGNDDSLEHGPLARAILANVPTLYDPEPEIFVERTIGRATDAPWLPFPLPVGFGDDDGNLTKLYTDAAGLDALPRIFEVDASYMRTLRARYAGARGAWYIDPPRGLVKARPDSVARAHDAVRLTTFAVGVTLGDGWLPARAVGDATVACTGARAAIMLGDATEHVLSMRVWPPLELSGHPLRMRVVAGEATIDEIRAFSRFTREYHLAPGVREVVLEAPETFDWAEGGGAIGMCLDSLEWK
jgi:hypothetical protein